MDGKTMERTIGRLFGNFEQPGPLLKTAAGDFESARKDATRLLGQEEMPHCGRLAEALEFHQLCRVTVGRHLDGRTWTEALAATRESALGSLMRPETHADAWQRAYLESSRDAAARFLARTERLS